MREAAGRAAGLLTSSAELVLTWGRLALPVPIRDSQLPPPGVDPCCVVLTFTQLAAGLVAPAVAQVRGRAERGRPAGTRRRRGVPGNPPSTRPAATPCSPAPLSPVPAGRGRGSGVCAAPAAAPRGGASRGARPARGCLHTLGPALQSNGPMCLGGRRSAGLQPAGAGRAAAVWRAVARRRRAARHVRLTPLVPAPNPAAGWRRRRWAE